ncbi:hypothetical protein [Streptococcus dysgalactiae]|uniref:hypothetical protein n=1 Tax=Streptococcus dysgalactiae TaxID=1334 RepID=UPI00194F2DAF|nr:hypothetical protein [Streptococcus dysgalactiae]
MMRLSRSSLIQLNNVHGNIRFSLEEEQNESLPFLDIRITRRPDGTIKRSVYRKSTWTAQYLHFNSFVPISYKRGLVRTLFNRARRICSEETLQEEFKTLQSALTENGYPDRFIRRFSNLTDRKPPNYDVPKKKVFMSLPFKGDDVSALVNSRLKTAVKRAYNTASTVIFYRTQRIPTPPVKQPAPLSAKSHVIYQFECGCGASYIGRTERQLQCRIKEHVPRWVKHKLTGSINQTPSENSVNRSTLPSTDTDILPTHNTTTAQTTRIFNRPTPVNDTT